MSFKKFLSRIFGYNPDTQDGPHLSVRPGGITSDQKPNPVSPPMEAEQVQVPIELPPVAVLPTLNDAEQMQVPIEPKFEEKPQEIAPVAIAQQVASPMDEVPKPLDDHIQPVDEPISPPIPKPKSSSRTRTSAAKVAPKPRATSVKSATSPKTRRKKKQLVSPVSN